MTNWLDLNELAVLVDLVETMKQHNEETAIRLVARKNSTYPANVRTIWRAHRG